MNVRSNRFQYVLATDLDGTLIPLETSEQNRVDLHTIEELIRKTNGMLLYVTGRHKESVLAALDLESLPRPRYIISDVGTRILQLDDDSDAYADVEEYSAVLTRLAGTTNTETLKRTIVERFDLRLQPDENQSRFKHSFFCDPNEIETIHVGLVKLLDDASANYGLVSSIDPKTGEGLIDLLPTGVNKSFAIQWLIDHLQFSADAVAFAGDSGNDLAALTSGFFAIVVRNATGTLRKDVLAHHRASQSLDRLHLSEREATSGVLEGFYRFLAQSPFGV